MAAIYVIEEMVGSEVSRRQAHEDVKVINDYVMRHIMTQIRAKKIENEFSGALWADLADAYRKNVFNLSCVWDEFKDKVPSHYNLTTFRIKSVDLLADK